MNDFAIKDLKQTLALKQKHLARLRQNVTRLNETITRAVSEIQSCEDAIKKAGKKEAKK